jgi:hypothetical protein
MDRDFLSDATVVAASRDFVAIRLATYESAAEAALLTSFFVGRSGALENTTFLLLAPDGVTQLSRAGRSPDFAFGHGREAASRMAAEMRRLAQRHPPRTTARALPREPGLRRALNVAACDDQPLVVARAPTAQARECLEARLSTVAWSERFRGRFQYVLAGESDDLGVVEGRVPADGFAVVQPGTYGLDGRVLARATSSAGNAAWMEALELALRAYVSRPKSIRTHVRLGREAGAWWGTAIPVTDPGPARDGPPGGPQGGDTPGGPPSGPGGP